MSRAQLFFQVGESQALPCGEFTVTTRGFFTPRRRLAAELDQVELDLPALPGIHFSDTRFNFFDAHGRNLGETMAGVNGGGRDFRVRRPCEPRTVSSALALFSIEGGRFLCSRSDGYGQNLNPCDDSGYALLEKSKEERFCGRILTPVSPPKAMAPGANTARCWHAFVGCLARGLGTCCGEHSSRERHARQARLASLARLAKSMGLPAVRL